MTTKEGDVKRKGGKRRLVYKKENVCNSTQYEDKLFIEKIFLIKSVRVLG
jgi:hypothetical protein